jgi:hypothetical protein
MNEILGTSLYVFIGVTVALGGGAAWLMGQMLGASWRPLWQVMVYSLLLGVTARFLIYALFDGTLLSPSGFVIDVAVVTAIGLISFRVARVRVMIRQYPWLYERLGPFALRAKPTSGS